MPAAFLCQLLSLLAVLFTYAMSASATTCPAGQQQVCVVACFCAPASAADSGSIFNDVQKMAATGLKNWIVESRETAAAKGVQPIPLHIRAQLEPYYDFQVLDSARYKVGDDVDLSAANTMMQNPDVEAVTLVDIIVFRTEDDAQNNVALWAHELKHVQQYQQWGVDDFAARYTRNYSTVEDPAYEMQRRVARELRANVAQASQAGGKQVR